MHGRALCAVLAQATGPAAPLSGTIGGASSDSYHGRDGAAAVRRCGTVAVTGIGGLSLRGRWTSPNARSLNAGWCSVGAAEMRAANVGTKPKRWVVRSSNSEQGQEILEEKVIQSSKDSDSGPPVLTIIAGIFVLVMVFWALGSLVSWIVGLFLRS